MKNSNKVNPTVLLLLQEVPKQQIGNINTLQRGLDQMFTFYFKNNNFLDNGGEDVTNEIIESYNFLGKVIKESNSSFFNSKKEQHEEY